MQRAFQHGRPAFFPGWYPGWSSYRFFSDAGPRFRRGRPPRNSKWLSFTTLAMEDARPSQRVRANWRAESQAALYQVPGLSPGYRGANSRLRRASRSLGILATLIGIP